MAEKAAAEAAKPAARHRSGPDPLLARALDSALEPQNAIGNAALGRLLSRSPKLPVSQPSDPSEREADRVAESLVGGDTCGGCSAADPCDSCAGPVEVHRSPTGPVDRESHTAASRLVSGLGSGVPLSAPLRSRFERGLGRDFGDVRIHTSTAASETTHALQANAFTLGNDVAFASGEFSPDTPDGQRLIAHELAHVAQQDECGQGVARVHRDDLATSLGPQPFVLNWADSPFGRPEAGSIVGPLPNGTRIDDHGLVVQQDDEKHVSIELGRHYVRLTANGDAEYAFYIDPLPLPPEKTEEPFAADIPFGEGLMLVMPEEPGPPVQRVVRIAATSGVSIDRTWHDQEDEGPELVVHVRNVVGRGHVGPETEQILGSGARDVPLGDNAVMLELDDDRIRISPPGSERGFPASEFPNWNFAYWIDPSWIGGPLRNVKPVVIVASPGVRVETGQVVAPQRAPALGSYDRVFAPVIIRVPHPSMVPEQGPPIDPTRFVAPQQFYEDPDAARLDPSIEPAMTAGVGSASVSINDRDSGVTIGIRPRDPAKGAAYAWQALPRTPTRGPQIRIVVDRNTLVHVEEPVPASVPRMPLGGVWPTDLKNVKHGTGMGSLDLFIVEVPDPLVVPRQGTPLNLEYYVMEEGGGYRQPDSYEWIYEASYAPDIMIGLFELAIGFIPIVGELYFIGQFVYGAVTGEDFWGRELSTGDLVLMGAFAVISAVGLVARGMRAVVGAARISKAARELGVTVEELEAVLLRLRGEVRGSDAKALSRVVKALEAGEDIAEADMKLMSALLGRIGAGEDILSGSRWSKSLVEVRAGEKAAQVGARPAELQSWYKILNQETRAVLRAEPQLAAEFERMDPALRRLLTLCDSFCLKRLTTPQQARLLDLQKKGGIMAETLAERQMQALIHHSKDINRTLSTLERAAANPARLGRLLKAQEAADVVLLGRKVLVKNPALRAQINEAVANGLDIEKLSQAMDRYRGNTSELIGRVEKLSQLKKAGVPGVDHVVEDLARGGGFAQGAEWSLRFIDEGKLWKQVSAFEAVERTSFGAREIDAIIGGVRYQFKSWFEFNPTTFVRQFEKDFELTNKLTQDLVWVFESRLGLNKKQLVAAAEQALRDSSLIPIEDLNRVMGLLPKILQLK